MDINTKETKSYDNFNIDNDIVTVIRLLDASQRLIKVNIDPPMYLNSILLYNSKTLMQLSSVYCLSNNKDKATNQGYTILLELQNTEDIPCESWEALENLVEKGILPIVLSDNTIIDDVLYLLNKYDIQVPYLPLNKPSSIINYMCNIIEADGYLFPRLDSNKANPTYYQSVVDAYAKLLILKTDNILGKLYKNNINLINDVFARFIDMYRNNDYGNYNHNSDTKDNTHKESLNTENYEHNDSDAGSDDGCIHYTSKKKRVCAFCAR